MAFNLMVAGQKTLSKFFRGFSIPGFVDSIKLRGYRLDKNTGICTFGVKLRGYSGGNLDLEIPMAFDMEKKIVQEPVLAFIDGRTHLISQGMFNKIMDRLNLDKKWSPGWMDINREVTEFRTVKQNDPNKYKVASQRINDPDYAEAFEDFNLCLAASPDTLHRAIALRAFHMLNRGFNRRDTLHRLTANFMGATTFNNISKLVDYTCSLLGKPSQPEIHLGMRKLSQGEEETLLTEEERKRREEEERAKGIIEGVPELTPELTPEEAQPIIQRMMTEPLPEGMDIYQQDIFAPVEEVITPEIVEDRVTPFISTPEQPIPYEQFMPQPEPPKESLPVISKPLLDTIIDVMKAMRIMEFLYTDKKGPWEGDRLTRRVMPHYIWNTDNGRQIVMSWDLTDGHKNDWKSFDLERIEDPGVRVNGEDTDMNEYYVMMYEDPTLEERSKAFKDDFFMPDPKYYRPTQIVREKLHAACLKELKRFSFRSGSVLREKINYLISVLENAK